MTRALLTPYDLSEPTRVGRRRFWKRILPVKTINYKGRKVTFDKQYHMDLADSFRKGAFEQVPLVFADGENRHNMDPRNFGGDILDMQARNDGTWALIEAEKDAAKAIRKNPRLGVSARIVEGVAKADGRTFNRAVNHVLLTMNPRVSGLGPWQAVDLSDEDTDIEVVDLTAGNYEEGSPMSTKLKTKKATGDTADEREIDLSSLTDEEFQQLLDLSATLLEGHEADTDEDGEDGDEEEAPKARKIRRRKSKTKITVEKDSEDDDPDDENGDGEDGEDGEDTDLSEVVDTDARTRVRQMEMDLAEQRWESERGDFERAGVPPFLLDLAEPVLSQPEALTIDLSEDESLDATDIIRQMLNGVKGVLDFSDEIGTAIDLSQVEGDGKSSADKLLDAWEQDNYS